MDESLQITETSQTKITEKNVEHKQFQLQKFKTKLKNLQIKRKSGTEKVPDICLPGACFFRFYA